MCNNYQVMNATERISKGQGERTFATFFRMRSEAALLAAGTTEIQVGPR